ncbi:MAG: winged helix-turn-helix domain-containing protein [Edaphobacter sp.]
MPNPQPARRYRFGVFEADATLGELRRQGIRVKLNAQPFQMLLILLERPGELLTREEISRALWPDGTFVDYEHGINSAVNRIREALGDTAGNPGFVETLARRGYRFVAPVERITLNEDSSITASEPEPQPESHGSSERRTGVAEPEPKFLSGILSSPEDLPRTSYPVVRTLFVLLQLMYLSFYIGALANLAEIEGLVSGLAKSTQILIVLIVTAAIMIPVRAFVLSMIVFHAPGARRKFLKIWPSLLLLDLLWALSPFLLLHHISFGLALSCTALLIYSPFAQRSLVLMGAGEPDR